VFDIVLPMLDKELTGKQFITGDALAAIDIAYFMELQQI
jgi:glutathione S-transferase